MTSISTGNSALGALISIYASGNAATSDGDGASSSLTDSQLSSVLDLIGGGSSASSVTSSLASLLGSGTDTNTILGVLGTTGTATVSTTGNGTDSLLDMIDGTTSADDVIAGLASGTTTSAASTATDGKPTQAVLAAMVASAYQTQQQGLTSLFG